MKSSKFALVKNDKQFALSLSVPKRAERVTIQLEDIIRDYDIQILLARSKQDKTRQELLELDQSRIQEALNVIQLYWIEEFRQREGIKHFLAGVGSYESLRNISSTWNGDKIND